MPVLRPKYQLNRVAIEGDRTTIPAEQFTQLTGRRYPYPRPGTRAPNSHNPGVHAPKLIPGPLMPKYMKGGGGAVLEPKFTLDHEQVQGVMPASTYARISGGELTTQPDIPTYEVRNSRLVATYPPRTRSRAYAPMRAPIAPALVIDWGAVFWGTVLGGVLTLGMVYGVIPAIAKATAKRIR